MDCERRAPSSEPVGNLLLAAMMASDTSSMPRPRVARASGSSCTRTAYFFCP